MTHKKNKLNYRRSDNGIMVYVDDECVKKINEAIKKTGHSRSSFFRWAAINAAKKIEEGRLYLD